MGIDFWGGTGSRMCGSVVLFDHNFCQVHGIATPMASLCSPRAVLPWDRGTDKSGQKEGVELDEEAGHEEMCIAK